MSIAPSDMAPISHTERLVKATKAGAAHDSTESRIIRSESYNEQTRLVKSLMFFISAAKSGVSELLPCLLK